VVRFLIRTALGGWVLTLLFVRKRVGERATA
jgi:hypothetical protein